jgi:hypothetical protein
MHHLLLTIVIIISSSLIIVHGNYISPPTFLHIVGYISTAMDFSILMSKNQIWDIVLLVWTGGNLEAQLTTLV